MRLDKYLKVSRLIKRRAIAKEACDAGRVSVNGKVARASLEVKIGDEIRITFGNREVAVKILDVQETGKKEEARELYTTLSPQEKFESK
ncbi:MAG: RNA-binding S4 domain-containing protein [Lachnospiraceae bacterium]|jgi:ribosomal 50S subunit-recycling heat shock protein|nr:RNA-binding S4 domain-containing protein [Lachnospiraceae bacterium]